MNNLPDWINPNAAVWYSFFAVIIGGALSMVRSDNPAIPITLSTRNKLIFATAFGVLQTVLQSKVGGLSWQASIVTALSSVGTGLGASGFRSTPSTSVSGGGHGSLDPVPAMVVPVVPPAPTHVRRWLPTRVLGMTIVCFMLSCKGANVPTVVTAIITDVNQACIDAYVVAPIFDPSLPAATVQSIKTDCNLLAVADSVIDQAIQALTTQPAYSKAKAKLLASKSAK